MSSSTHIDEQRRRCKEVERVVWQCAERELCSRTAALQLRADHVFDLRHKPLTLLVIIDIIITPRKANVL